MSNDKKRNEYSVFRWKRDGYNGFRFLTLTLGVWSLAMIVDLACRLFGG